MSSITKALRIVCLAAGVALMVYGFVYPVLRITHVLVARCYIVCHYNRWGDEWTVEHFDIGRGGAFGPDGEYRSVSAIATVFAPLSWMELRVRGFGEYPVTWPCSKVGLNEELARVKMAILSTNALLPVTVNGAPPDVYRRWRETASYYALAEILDALMKDHATKKDVLWALGDPNWGTVNQDPARTWAYQGFGKREPDQDKLILTFDGKDQLTEIGWVSE